MNAALEVKKFMEEMGLNVIDVASFLKIHPDTVERFLHGKKPARRSTVAAFERLLASKTAVAKRQKPLSI